MGRGRRLHGRGRVRAPRGVAALAGGPYGLAPLPPCATRFAADIGRDCDLPAAEVRGRCPEPQTNITQICIRQSVVSRTRNIVGRIGSCTYANGARGRDLDSRIVDAYWRLRSRTGLAQVAALAASLKGQLHHSLVGWCASQDVDFLRRHAIAAVRLMSDPCARARYAYAFPVWAPHSPYAFPVWAPHSTYAFPVWVPHSTYA